jgi:hypothetical protein
MSKQTAVEWIVSKLSITFQTMYSEEIEQAKAMEKEQIIKAFCEGYDHDGDNYDGAEISYYNRTYKGGDK